MSNCLPASGIFHKVQGEECAPPLVLVHGLFGSLENLGVIARQLANKFRVYSIDLPNHGRSRHVQTMTLASMADQVTEWLDEQGLSEVRYLGHSLGGKLGMELALMSPDRIRQLVVADISPIAYPPRHNDVFSAFAAVDLNQINGRSEADKIMAEHVGETAVRSFLLKNLVQDGTRYLWRMNLQGILTAYHHIIGANGLYSPFDKPTLFIKGELSPYIQADHWPEVTKRFPNASIKMIQGTEHWLHAEKPGIFAGIVERFLE